MKAFLIAAVLLVACDSKTKPSLSDVKREAKEAVDTAAQFAKNHAVAAAEEQLKAMDDKIGALRAELEKRNGAARTVLKNSIGELESKRAELAKQVDQMKNEGEDKWRETEKKISGVGEAFETSYQDLKTKLDKI